MRTERLPSGLGLLCAVALVVTWSTAAGAYSTYDSCEGCHGDFRAGPYMPPFGRPQWSANLHDVHRRSMLTPSDCTTCHIANPQGRARVFLWQSDGAAGFDPISCMGCHGRAEDEIGNPNFGGKSGAGLRQHHYNAGTTSCVGCHPDSNPASFTPVGEHVLPPFYFLPDGGRPAKPTDPCNRSGEEDHAGTRAGLDNDGDVFVDANGDPVLLTLADPDCATPTPTATPTATPTPTASPTPTATPSPTPTPTATPSPTPTATPSVTPTPTATPTPGSGVTICHNRTTTLVLSRRAAKRRHLWRHPRDRRGACGDGRLTICHDRTTTLVLGRWAAKRDHLWRHSRDERGPCPGP